MKKAMFLFSILAVSATWGDIGHENIGGHTIRIDMGQAIVSRTPLHHPAQAPWYTLSNITAFVINFGESNSFTTTLHYGSSLCEEVQVRYQAPNKGKTAYVKLEGSDFTVDINLTYSGNNIGESEIAWHEAGNTRHFRSTPFIVKPAQTAHAGVNVPEEIMATAPELWDDGLDEILSSLETAHYSSAVDKLYQRRLLALLPLIMIEYDPSYTTPDFKGNTALHYACGLGHTKLVDWLIKHGADLEARTHKGAGVDACISGRDGATIKSMLKAARAQRDKAHNGPIVSEEEAHTAAMYLQNAFAGTEDNPLRFVISARDDHSARLLYHYVKHTKHLPAGVSKTDEPGTLLTRILSGNVSEELFVEWLLHDLRLRRQYLQEEDADGLALALLPHMILKRDVEEKNFDEATAVYRAANEGNTELVRWLLRHGATPDLRDSSGNKVELKEDTPNLDAIKKIIAEND